MDIFIHYNSDDTAKAIHEAEQASNETWLRRIHQDTERANELWKSFILLGGGEIVAIEGACGQVKIDGTHLCDIPKIKCQYEQIIGSTITIGIGIDLASACKALQAAQLTSVGQICFYNPQVEEILSQKLEKADKDSKEHKGHKGHGYPVSAEKYSAKQSRKMSRFREHHLGHPVKFTGDPAQEQDVDEAQALVQQIQSSPQTAGPEATKPEDHAKHIVDQLNRFADKHEEDKKSKESEGLQELKQRIAQVLLKIQEKVPQIAQLQEEYPDLYEGYLELAQGLTKIAKLLPLNKSETLQKESHPAAEGRLHLPIGTLNNEKIKIKDPKTGKEKWRSVKAGMIMGLDGQAVSPLTPNKL